MELSTQMEDNWLLYRRNMAVVIHTNICVLAIVNVYSLLFSVGVLALTLLF